MRRSSFVPLLVVTVLVVTAGSVGGASAVPDRSRADVGRVSDPAGGLRLQRGPSASLGLTSPPLQVMPETPSEGSETPSNSAETSLPSESSMPTVAPETTIGLSIETYVVGGRAVIRGTAPPDVDAIAVYVEAPTGWELLDLNGDGIRSASDAVPVGPDGRWARDVVLSETRSILAAPGERRIGALPLSEAEDSFGLFRTTLSPDDGPTADLSFTVRVPLRQEPTVFQDVDGQVAVEDGVVTVRGLAPGSDAVLALVVDVRGNLVSDIVDVGGDDVFETDLELTAADGNPLRRGFAVGVVLSSGRDGRVGDGRVGEDIVRGAVEVDLREFEAYLQGRARSPRLTQRQVLDVLTAESIADAGSDDLWVVDTFAITSAQTSIDAVYPANESVEAGVEPIEPGETVVVRGRTNRRPGDNTISVDVYVQPSGQRVALADVDDWGRDGRWTVQFEPSDVTPGTYTVEAFDGEDRDSVRVVVANATVETPGASTIGPPPATETPT